MPEAWQFFSDPNNLKIITPSWLKLQLTSTPQSDMYPGTILHYKVHPVLSFPLNWVTETTHVSKPNYFVDEQRYRPYRTWHHQHIFKELPGGVLVQDIVEYTERSINFRLYH